MCGGGGGGGGWGGCLAEVVGAAGFIKVSPH